MSKFSLLKTIDQQVKTQIAEAAAEHQHNILVAEGFTTLAEEHGTTSEKLLEAVTHVLANIIAQASQGVPVKAMSAASLAGFLAGVESLASALPKVTPDQRTRSLDILSKVAIGPDGMVTPEAGPIAQLGAKKVETHMKYGEIVKKYVAASQAKQEGAGQELVAAARQLQSAIDRAMRGGVTPSHDIQSRVQQGANDLTPVQRPQAQAPQSIRPALSPQDIK